MVLVLTVQVKSLPAKMVIAYRLIGNVIWMAIVPIRVMKPTICAVSILLQEILGDKKRGLTSVQNNRLSGTPGPLGGSTFNVAGYAPVT